MRILIFLLLCTQVFGATYYVDFTTGSDTDSGLTEALAWKTIVRTNDGPYETGDTILFKRGEEWEPEAENLRLRSVEGFNGSSATQATVGAYGTGDKPIIWGAAVAATWVDEADPIFKKDYAAGTGRDPVVVLEDDVLLTYIPWDTDLATTALSAGSFTYDPDDNTNYYSYVRCTDGADPDTHTMRVTQMRALNVNSHAVVLENRTYVTIENLDVRGGGWNGIRCQTQTGNSDGIIVKDCDVSYSRFNSIDFHNISTSGTTTMSGMVASDNTVTQNGGAGIAMGGSAAGRNAYNGIMQNNTATGNGWAVGQGAFYAARHYNPIIRGNSASTTVEFGGSEGVGIYFDVHVINGVIDKNVTYDNEGAGIQVSGFAGTTDGCVVSNNLVYGNGTVATAGQDEGIRFSHTGDNNSAFNNTVYDNPTGIGVGTQTNVTLKNNIVFENTNYEIETGDLAGLDIDYNCIYHSGGGTFMRFATVAKNWADWLTASSQSAHSINTDPLEVDATTANFHLTQPSPCIDAGDVVGIQSDYDGVPVLGFQVGTSYYGGPDIGAYEFVTFKKRTGKLDGF